MARGVNVLILLRLRSRDTDKVRDISLIPEYSFL